MSIPRPSRTLLMGVAVLVLAIAALFLPREDAKDLSKNQNSMEYSSQRIRATDSERSHTKGSPRSKRLIRIEKLISEQFPEERDNEFNNGPGELSLSYREKGLLDFCGQMRNALRGDEDSLAEIFTTYNAEPEGYTSIINILIENLGDGYFFQQVQKQPESIQYGILGQIWQTIYRFPLDYQGDDSIPAANGGLYYPKTGELFLGLLEKELQSDYWQKQKRKKANKAEMARPRKPSDQIWSFAPARYSYD